MEYLPYERIAQLVTISALNKESSAMAGFILQLKVSERQICIKFSDYVKSQVHLNISYSLYDRHISEYVKSLYFIQGDEKYRSDAEKVLRYFYADMSNFLINNPVRVDMTIIVDADLGEEVVIDPEDVEMELLKILDSANSPDLPKLIGKFLYSDIFDSVDDLEDAKAKSASYALAAILGEYAENEKLSKVRLNKCC
ncbi:hypothetical protein AALB53_08395 [Lachnospiraceae bacterium 47-T17]